MLTADHVRTVLAYDASTGEFRWKAPDGNGKRAPGRVAGCVNSAGYRVIMVDGTLYYAHHLAWLYVHGEWPLTGIDHRDLAPGNNAIDNLREATGSQNNANKRMQANNTSGFKGVTRPRGVRKWRAMLTFRGVHHHLGCFDTAEEAGAAYENAARRICGEFARAA